MASLPQSAKIALDISAINPAFRESHVTRGIGRYVRELLSGMQALAGDCPIFGCFDHCELLDNSLAAKAINYLPCGRVTARQQLLYPFILNASAFKEIKYLHFPAHMDAAAWGLKPYILTVLDLIPLILKDMYAPEVFNWRFKLARFLELRAIKGASHIIAISETTASDVHRMLGIPREKITVTPLGVDRKFFVADPPLASGDSERLLREELGLPLDAPVLLYVGGIDQRKNVPQLLNLLKQLRMRRAANGKARPVLVLAGSIKNDKNYPALMQQVTALGLDQAVFQTGFLEDAKLLQVYKITRLFCFLSLYEGFGLPPLEAMATGTPVLSSNRSCLPEVLGSAALMADPDDLQRLVELAESVLESDERFVELSRAGVVQAHKFTWSKTAELTLAVYEKLTKS
jgi:glycosyltransferase involved in cell wall biosynthesis